MKSKQSSQFLACHNRFSNYLGVDASDVTLKELTQKCISLTKDNGLSMRYWETEWFITSFISESFDSLDSKLVPLHIVNQQWFCILPINSMNNVITYVILFD